MTRTNWMMGVLGVAALGLYWGCGGSAEETSAKTPEEARAFVEQANASLREVWVAAETANWAYSTDINDENQAAVAEADEQTMATLTALIAEAATFDEVEGIDPDTARQLRLLKAATSLPAPDDAEKRGELAEISSKMAGMYGTGKVCEGSDCRDLGDLSKTLAESDDWDEQLEAWRAWRTVSPPMKADYARFVELGNEGARDIGYSDVGELWRSKYDMSPAELEAEVDRLYAEVKPLYEQLHCTVRAALSDKYGEDRIPTDGVIPAHVTGNMWAQSWEGVYPLVTPHPDEASIDLTALLDAKGYDELKMVKTAEGFFTSMGLDPLPETFYERSLFTRPDDREVECHASAWDVGMNDDLRIKMCIRKNAEDFAVLHHELGHNYYYHYYYQLPPLYQTGAHDGFHEAIGDSLQLSITPAYLGEIGLLDEVPETNDKAVLNEQMQVALQKVAFLPFGRMIDQWRWDVFSGEVGPDDYNAHWWTLRERFQGIGAPGERPADAFDPGAKYHIPANTPYLRYFFAHVLQFQFHKALCEEAGHEGPLHTCTVYGSEEAGAKLQAMLELGASKPWPDALEAMTGERQMSAEPMMDYFQPLMTYLEAENADRDCGW